MRDARLEQEDRLRWNHTWAVLAQVHNYHRDPKRSKAIDTRQFFPWGNRGRHLPAPPPTAEDREMLRKVFAGGKK